MKFLRGLVVVNSLEKLPVGVNRSIKSAAEPLLEQGIELRFVLAKTKRSILKQILRSGGLHNFDFVIFNGLSSINFQSDAGCFFAHILLKLNIPLFIYWHESDWVLERMNSKDSERVSELARHPKVKHLTASSHCSRCIKSRYPRSNPVEIYECAETKFSGCKAALASTPPLILNIASIQERKGTDLFVETAIRVCNSHPTVEFMWLGQGKEYGDWKAKIETAKLKNRILFPGHVDSAELILRRASALFISSRDDPFPLAVLEAMSLSKTVVSFGVGGIPEALGDSGIIIPDFDVRTACSEILKLVSKDPKELVNYNARERYEENYTPRKYAERLSLIVRSSLKKNK